MSIWRRGDDLEICFQIFPQIHDILWKLIVKASLWQFHYAPTMFDFKLQWVNFIHYAHLELNPYIMRWKLYSWWDQQIEKTCRNWCSWCPSSIWEYIFIIHKRSKLLFPSNKVAPMGLFRCYLEDHFLQSKMWSWCRDLYINKQADFIVSIRSKVLLYEL